MAKAFYIADLVVQGRINRHNQNAQFEFFDYAYEKCKGVRSYRPVPPIQSEQISAAAAAINAAKTYDCLGSRGNTWEAEEEFKTFVEKTGIPAVWTILGLLLPLPTH